MLRSDCASALSDKGLYCPLTGLLDTNDYFNGEQRPGRSFAYAQIDLNLCILCMFESTFLLDATKMKQRYHS